MRALVQLQRLHKIEHFQHGKALGRRWRFKNLDVAVGAANGLAPAGGLCGQVRFGEQAAFFFGKAGEFTPYFAFVKASAAPFSNRLQSLGQAGVAQKRARAWRFAVGFEDRHGLGVWGQIIGHGVDKTGQARRHRKAIARIADGAL